MSSDLIIINEIIAELTRDKPCTMKTILNIIDNLNDQESFYGLLIGEIQSGKTPAQMILIWIFSRHPSFMGSVCFITKNLDAIRRDIMSKFDSDLINNYIVRVCARHGIDRTTALKKYGLTYSIYNQKFKIKHEAGKVEAGHVQVMLMQRDNFIQVRNWYASLTSDTPVLFLIDEMHEMYGGVTNMMNNNGLETPQKIPNVGMLHWLKNLKNLKTYIIGVTATPYSPMTADPICWPTKLFMLESDAPAVNLTYYGYKDHVLTNVDIQAFNDSNMDAMTDIIRRPHNVLDNGNTEVKFICITTALKNEKQEAIKDRIEKEFGSLVNCLVFNQTNDIPLHSWLHKKILTREVCYSGAIVIIGRACMAAGITIKPKEPLSVKYDDITYQLTGITDQFMPNTDINITSMKQLMRILGWFPNGHRATLWLPSEDLFPVYETEIGTVTRQFIDTYDTAIGPASLEQVMLSSKHINKFYGDSFYRVIKRFGKHLYTTPECPAEFEVIPTTFQPIPSTMEGLNLTLTSNLTIGSYYKNTKEQHKLRTALCFTRTNMAIGYDNDRYQDIMKFALLPSQNNPLTRINGFLWGPQGHNSLIKNCYIVNFTQDWDDPCRATGDNATFQLPDGSWALLKNIKTLKHQRIPQFKDIAVPTDKYPNSFSHEHHSALNILDIISKIKMGIKPRQLTLKIRPKTHSIASK